MDSAEGRDANDTRVGSLDDALAKLAPMSPEYGSALSDHAPMVVEALDRLHRADRIAPFLDAWMPKLRPFVRGPEPELGDFDDSAAHELRSIEDVGPREATRRWFARAGGGLVGAAFHGVIRVAHALDGLARRDVEARRRELGRALAYAEIRSATLPAPRRVSASFRLEAALTEAEPSPLALSSTPGLITPALLERVRAHPWYGEAGPAVTAESFDEVIEASVRLFVDGVYTPSRTFTMLHAVTGVDAIARVSDELDDDGRAHALRLATAALVAMRIAFVGPYARDAAAPPRAPRRFDALIATALESLNDHAIKLAAALDRRRALLGDAWCAAALGRWLERIGR